MKNISFFVIIIVSIVFTFVFCGYGHAWEVEDSVIADGLEKGNALVWAKILSRDIVGHQVRGRKVNYYHYKVRVKPIIPGDLKENDFDETIELFGGTKYYEDMKPGAMYAIFIAKECLNFYNWTFRDVRLKGSAKELEKHSQAVYEKTDIYKFREKKIGSEELPSLPAGIAEICEKFRDNPTNRTEYAKQIYKSDIGSREDESDTSGGLIKYLQPKIALTRQQLIALLGEPTLKYGWVYKWSCGQREGSDRVGVLEAAFNKDEKTTTLIFTFDEKINWVESCWQSQKQTD